MTFRVHILPINLSFARINLLALTFLQGLLFRQLRYLRWLVLDGSDLDGGLADNLADFAHVCVQLRERVLVPRNQVIELLVKLVLGIQIQVVFLEHFQVLLAPSEGPCCCLGSHQADPYRLIDFGRPSSFLWAECTGVRGAVRHLLSDVGYLLLQLVILDKEHSVSFSESDVFVCHFLDFVVV